MSDNCYLIVSGIAEERRASRAAWLDTVGLFDEIAARLESHGIRIGYHNQYVEFQPVEDELSWDTFFGNTRADVVMQLDTGNIHHGGAELARFLRKYPDRAQLVPLK